MWMQLKGIDRRRLGARLSADDFPRDWTSMDELAAATDREVADLRRHRLETAWGPNALAARFDAAMRTDAVEWMDRDTLTDEERTRMVLDLHRFNRVIFSYTRFVHMLRPIIAAVHADVGRPVRVLELASGSGEATLALDRVVRRLELPAELTGSDIVQTHVDRANAEARRQGDAAQFRRLDALQLGTDVQHGDYDIVFIIQSAHHFDPGQLAVMMAQARAAGARYFVIIDGRRSAVTALLLPPAMALFGTRKLVHDGWITARKFYADAELLLMGHVAAPDARGVRLIPRPPAMVQLAVEF